MNSSRVFHNGHLSDSTEEHPSVRELSSARANPAADPRSRCPSLARYHFSRSDEMYCHILKNLNYSVNFLSQIHSYLKLIIYHMACGVSSIKGERIAAKIKVKRYNWRRNFGVSDK